jgi:ketosteroid isomerase-like protein
MSRAVPRSRDRLQLVRDVYDAYQAGDPGAVDKLLTDDVTFSSPADVGIDKATYFERCWGSAGRGLPFEFKRLIEAGDEVVVTYEAAMDDGRRGRNTEVFTFEGDKISRVEVYFGWNVE